MIHIHTVLFGLCPRRVEHKVLDDQLSAWPYSVGDCRLVGWEGWERKGVARWIGRKEAHVMGDPWPHLEIVRSKSPGHLTPWLKVSHIFRTEMPTNFKLGILMEYNDPLHRHTRGVVCGQFDLRGRIYIMSRHQFDVLAHNSTEKKLQKHQNWQEGGLCHRWHSAPFPRSRSPQNIADMGNQPYLLKGKAC